MPDPIVWEVVSQTSVTLLAASSVAAMPCTVELGVVIFKPTDGNYHHWSFHVQFLNNEILSSKKHAFFSTMGDQHELKPSVSYTDPQQTKLLYKRVIVGYRPEEEDYTRLADIIENVEMHNGVLETLGDCEFLGISPKYAP